MGWVAELYAYPACRYAIGAAIAAMFGLGIVVIVWGDVGVGAFLGLLGLGGLAFLAAAFSSCRRFQTRALKSQILAYAREHGPSSFTVDKIKATRQVPSGVRDRAIREAYAHCYRKIIYRGGPTKGARQQLSGFAKALGISPARQNRIEAHEDRAALPRDTQLMRHIAAVLRVSPTALNAAQVVHRLKADLGHKDVTAAKVRSLMQSPLRDRVLAGDLGDGATVFTKKASFRQLASPAPDALRAVPPEDRTSRTSSTGFAEFLRPPLPEEVRLATRPTNTNDVRAEALRGAVGADDHLDYASSLLGKYSWDAPSQQKVTSLLAEIADRKNDPRLFLGVVGEFSSGKSTFINALIRDDLLQTDVLQGTTAAATVLSYGREADVEVFLLDGVLWHAFMDWVRPSPEVSEKEAMRQFVRRFTAEESIARNVAAVNILHPAEAFRRGLVIVDTPGTNAENPRHVKVAGQALRRICDAAIVVIPADVPGSQTLMAFLKEHLADVLHRCVFILNKTDVVRRPHEEDRLLKTVTAILERELGIEAPVVLPAAPQLVLDGLGAEGSGEPNADGLGGRLRVEQFKQMERDLYRFLEANKDVVLLERLSLCLSTLLKHLQDRLRNAASAYQRRREALERSRIQNLAVFVSQQKQKHLGNLGLRTGRATSAFPQSVGGYRDSVLAGIRRDVNNATSTNSLKSVVEKATMHYMSLAQQELQQALGDARAAIERAAEDEHAKFKAEFASLYRSLATLEGMVSISGTALPSSQSLPVQIGGHTQALAKGLQSTIEQGYAGVGVGAAIGTVIFPGIGTVVGGVLGAVLADMFGPSLEETKRKVLADVTAAVRESFNTSEEAAVRNLDGAAREAGSSLCRKIDRYFQIYENTVQDMTRQLAAEKVRLREAQEVIEGDLGQLESRLNHLERTRKQLREARL